MEIRININNNFFIDQKYSKRCTPPPTSPQRGEVGEGFYYFTPANTGLVVIVGFFNLTNSTF